MKRIEACLVIDRTVPHQVVRGLVLVFAAKAASVVFPGLRPVYFCFLILQEIVPREELYQA